MNLSSDGSHRSSSLRISASAPIVYRCCRQSLLPLLWHPPAGTRFSRCWTSSILFARRGLRYYMTAAFLPLLPNGRCSRWSSLEYRSSLGRRYRTTFCGWCIASMGPFREVAIVAPTLDWNGWMAVARLSSPAVCAIVLSKSAGLGYSGLYSILYSSGSLPGVTVTCHHAFVLHLLKPTSSDRRCKATTTTTPTMPAIRTTRNSNKSNTSIATAELVSRPRRCTTCKRPRKGHPRSGCPFGEPEDTEKAPGASAMDADETDTDTATEQEEFQSDTQKRKQREANLLRLAAPRCITSIVSERVEEGSLLVTTFGPFQFVDLTAEARSASVVAGYS
ncbi:hypothetical protein C8F01DRAFT_691490 [Mycena amicta]|nr:hypothetical protein C8F01DRAFT_691490 [Mycena amicta]